MTADGGNNTQVVVEVTVIDDCRIEGCRVLLNDLVRLLGDHRCFSAVLGIYCKMVRLDSSERNITYHSCRDRERPGRRFSSSPCAGSKQQCERQESRNRGVSSSNTQRSLRPSSTTSRTIRALLPIPRSVAYIQFFRCYTIVHASDDLLSDAIGQVRILLSGTTVVIRTR